MVQIPEEYRRADEVELPPRFINLKDMPTTPSKLFNG
jgi:hypothetical protein